MSEKSKEQFQFDVDTNQLMDIIIKSVYSSNEIFLRELISNSNDACDKLKTMYMDLSEKGFKVDNASSLEIEIIPDLVNKTLTIKDNGIGMKKSDLISFIGTIANSGTRKFKEALEQKSESTDISHLIGQFGVGFYSSYLVAEQVDIVTRHPEDGAYLWSSNGRDTYSISDYEGEDFNHEGDDNVKVKDDEAKEDQEPKDDQEPKIEEVTEEQPKQVPMKKEKYIEKTKINTDRPLWERKLKDVSEEDLTSFYKNISGDWDSFLAVDQWTVEGMLTLKLLLFIPKRSRMDFFGGKNKKNKNIKLYCNNVFVTDDFGDNIPEWMNFVVGVVASSDISMNVSRELIQGSSLMKLVKKTLPQKVLDMINKLSNDQEKYSSFYNEFGNCLKLAVMEAQDNQREKFVNTLRYSTNKNENISFKKY
ncbi:Heat shock protein 90, partial [Nosema bombycis CQ1]